LWIVCPEWEKRGIISGTKYTIAQAKAARMRNMLKRLCLWFSDKSTETPISNSTHINILPERYIPIAQNAAIE
jgi:hypothetical protein